ncbi:tetratricopeptide repeat-containing sensor histidine kinase [Fulvivirga sediminis]|uniref:histidine kinase n=1 Tax=Fulvivirga sediminis TaxID=2803949 RepID=A0A937K2R2_9BACT|nr:tetratricopeptide repeat-containing sensor histidine kinase [Fulvivirga sediminis]MBL3658107.1 tetratricopeptide repeat-containing sensor histidine kinase [Fulvivirga sediminis]
MSISIKKVWKVVIIMILPLFVFTNSFSQDLARADSLINVLGSSDLVLADTLKERILWGIYTTHPNPEVVIKYADQAIDLELNNNYPDNVKKEEWLALAYLNKGQAYKIKGDLEEALRNLLKSMRYANVTHKDHLRASVYNEIAGVYLFQTNYSTAIEYYNLSINIFRISHDSIQLATTLLNTGDLYRLNQKEDSALLYFAESKIIFEKNNYDIGIAYNEGNIGLVYAQQGKYDSAEMNLANAIGTLERFGDKYPVAVYNISMADIYKDRGEYKKALKYAQSSFDVAIEEGFKEQVRDASQKLSEIYSELGDYQLAFDYQGKYYAYKDSVVDQETIRKMADMRTEYEVNQKQAEVDLLESEKRRQSIVAISLGAVAVLVGIVAFLLYKNNKHRRQANNLLREQKEEIEAQRDQLDELNSTKDRFFSIISHDLRGPVHAFKGMSRLIKILVEEENIEDLKELNVHFDNSVNQLSSLLDDLLDWAVAQQGNIPVKPEKVELNKLTDDLFELFHNMARAKDIELTADFKEDLVLHADMNCLNTILRNILNNALKFTPDKGKIKLTAERSNGMVAISVEDTGIGISKDKLDSLFKLDGNKRSWGTQGEKGLGLGLQLVYQFTELNGGKVTVKSEENKGSIFTVYLPAYIDC